MIPLVQVRMSNAELQIEADREKSILLSVSREVEKKEQEKSLLLSFSNHLATVRDITGLKFVIKRYLKQLFQIKEYIITTRNEDNKSYSYFLHDLAGVDPTDEGFRTITSNKMPITGSMTGAVLKSEEPVIFKIEDIIRERKISFPSASFWKAAGADRILGIGASHDQVRSHL